MSRVCSISPSSIHTRPSLPIRLKRTYRRSCSSRTWPATVLASTTRWWRSPSRRKVTSASALVCGGSSRCRSWLEAASWRSRLRPSSEPSGACRYSEPKAYCARPRRAKPQPLRPSVAPNTGALASSARRWRLEACMGIELLHHDIDQAARYDHDFFRGGTFDVLLRIFAGQGQAFDLGLVGAGGHAHFAAQFAVDLQHQLQLVLHQGAGVGLGPGGIEQIALFVGIAQLAPQHMGQVRGGGVEHAQQDAKAFDGGDLGLSAVQALE